MKLEELLNKIEDLRNDLDLLISKKSDLQHPDIISASEHLDKVLNEYETLTKQHMKQ